MDKIKRINDDKLQQIRLISQASEAIEAVLPRLQRKRGSVIMKEDLSIPAAIH